MTAGTFAISEKVTRNSGCLMQHYKAHIVDAAVQRLTTAQATAETNTTTSKDYGIAGASYKQHIVDTTIVQCKKMYALVYAEVCVKHQNISYRSTWRDDACSSIHRTTS